MAGYHLGIGVITSANLNGLIADMLIREQPTLALALVLDRGINTRNLQF